jgi:PPOX class probable F420-dependent enzyme
MPRRPDTCDSPLSESTLWFEGRAIVVKVTASTTHVLPDPSTPFGQTVRRRLREEEQIWLTTVSASGAPQPNPVWFLWQEDPGSDWGDGSFLIYHLNKAARLDSLVQRPRVALNFNSSQEGVVIFAATVEILKDGPKAKEVPEYAAKYREHVARITSGGQSLEEFMAAYSVVSRITPTKVRGF